MATITGSCLCGKIRYHAEAEPKFVSICHCRDCQKFTGSAFATVVALPKTALVVTGVVKGFTKRGDTGKPIERFFCPDCGASIMDEAEALPGFVMIEAGTLDDTELAEAHRRRFTAPARSPGCTSIRRRK